MCFFFWAGETLRGDANCFRRLIKIFQASYKLKTRLQLQQLLAQMLLLPLLLLLFMQRCTNSAKCKLTFYVVATQKTAAAAAAVAQTRLRQIRSNTTRHTMMANSSSSSSSNFFLATLFWPKISRVSARLPMVLKVNEFCVGAAAGHRRPEPGTGCSWVTLEEPPVPAQTWLLLLLLLLLLLCNTPRNQRNQIGNFLQRAHNFFPLTFRTVLLRF